ncbi:MAG: protein-glutamate O-methyltransferase CheR [Pseudomonadota bacterium]
MTVPLDLIPFKTLIKQYCGLLFEGTAEGKLDMVVRERLVACQIPEAVGYYARLLRDAGEMRELVNRLTINETYFNREPEHLNLLMGRLVPRLLARPSTAGPLKILSAGCSTGEEPYSIAMALYEKYGESTHRLFQILGGDIDQRALEQAQTACYTEFSFRGLAESLRQRYFDQDGEKYRVKETLRRLVTLLPLNLLATSYPDALQKVDIVFFRNVSIYFDIPTRRLIQTHLASLLKADGYLLLGTTETLANDLGILSLVSEDGVFYFARNPPFAMAQAVLPMPAMTHRDQTTRRPRTPPLAMAMATDFDTAFGLARDQRHDEALTHISSLTRASPQDPRPHLLHAHIRLQRREFAEAETAAQQALALDNWFVDGLVLMGLIALKWRGQPEDAIRWFKQAVYVRTGCWPAHYYLAELYRSGGNRQLARREYRLVLNQLDAETEPDGDLKAYPLVFPLAELRLLCERHLSQLADLPRIPR